MTGGTTVGTITGPLDIQHEALKDDSWEKHLASICFPPRAQWPVIETFCDIFWHGYMCEFTVQTPMARNAFAWGHLAARE